MEAYSNLGVSIYEIVRKCKGKTKVIATIMGTAKEVEKMVKDYQKGDSKYTYYYRKYD